MRDAGPPVERDIRGRFDPPLTDAVIVVTAGNWNRRSGSLVRWNWSIRSTKTMTLRR